MVNLHKILLYLSKTHNARLLGARILRVPPRISAAYNSRLLNR